MGQRGHVAGIHAGRKEAANLNIGDLVCLHALFHRRADLVLPLFQCAGIIGVKLGLPVALHRQLPGFPFQPVGGHQFFDALEEGILPRGILIGKIQRQLLFVQLFLEAGVGQKALDLAAKQQLAGFVLVIIERLDAKMVARAEQRFVLAVPDGKSEHAAQLLQHLLAPLLVPVQQNFGVGPGGEGVPGAHQFGGQLLEVVDLAVKDDGEVLVLIEHGLFAALQVNDGKAALAKGCRAFNKLALAIGAAVGDGIHHALQNFLHVGACADKANNSTHGYNPQLAAELKTNRRLLLSCPGGNRYCLYDMPYYTRFAP